MIIGNTHILYLLIITLPFFPVFLKLPFAKFPLGKKNEASEMKRRRRMKKK